jgi:nucleoid-associated protein YgaU
VRIDTGQTWSDHAKRPARDPKLAPEEDAMTDEQQDAWDATQWHEVKKGETLWKIAQEHYGDGSLYPIFEANRDVLKDPNLIKVGQKLRIP